MTTPVLQTGPTTALNETALRRHPVTVTNQPDELLAALGTTYGLRGLRLVGPVDTSRRHVLRAVRDPRVAVGYIHSGLGLKVDSRSATGYFVAFAVSGTVRAERGGDRVVNSPTVAAVYNPGDLHVLRPDEVGASTLGVSVDRDLVEEELALLLGREVDAPVRFELAVDLAHGPGTGVRALAGGLVQRLDEEGAAEHPVIRLHLARSLVAGLLLGHRHTFSEALRTGYAPPRPRHLRRALDFLEANLAEPVTLGQVAAAAGCSARTVDAVFREHLGVSPLARQRELRLDRVRRDLAATGEPVAEVAYRWGFTHLGRFAQAYRGRFGELPSRTARQG
jgi:AraC-like DNA-binding protein